MEILLHLHLIQLGGEGQETLQRIVGLGDHVEKDLLDAEVLPRDGGGWFRRLAASPTMSLMCWAVTRAILAGSGEPESGGVVCMMWERALPALSLSWASWDHRSRKAGSGS